MAWNAPFPGRLPSGPALERSVGAKTIRLCKNKDFLLAGQFCRCAYINHDGWLFRYKILHNGSRQIVDFVLPGQIFGIQAVLFRRALYSVATITETSLSAVAFDLLDDGLDRNPRLLKALLWSAACEGAMLGEHLIDAARRTAYERLSHLLLELFVWLRAVGLTEGGSFHMPLTQELIGDALGLTTVHVNRTLRALREDKLVGIEGKVVTIRDFEALALLSDFENSYLGDAVRAIRDELMASDDGEPSAGS
ncbi:MAG: Crp/Fnr family transcriptional regulator [Rhizobiales bacterium]|nr:Crp/Fnr family transcriptional regulator [Hyphomicrobiales bacterium]